MGRVRCIGDEFAAVNGGKGQNIVGIRRCRKEGVAAAHAGADGADPLGIGVRFFIVEVAYQCACVVDNHSIGGAGVEVHRVQGIRFFEIEIAAHEFFGVVRRVAHAVK